MLKVGCASKKEQYIDLIVGAIQFVIAIAILLLLVFLTEIKVVYDCAIAFAYFLISFIITTNIARKNAKITKIAKRFYKTCDYKRYVSDIEKIKKNDLEKETLTYVMILKTNIEFSVDYTNAINEYNKLKRPKLRVFSASYNMLTCLVYIHKKDYDKALGLAKKYCGEKTLSSDDYSYIHSLVDINKGIKIENIEELFPTKKGLLFTKLFNADVLIKYYENKDIEKAKEYAKLILESNTELEEFNKNARRILG